MLEIKGLRKAFGGVVAVTDFSLTVEKSMIVGLIGPNGAGKTTVANLICGIHKPDKGEIYLDEEPISGLKPSRIARKGVGRTFQITRVFRGISVLDNMLIPISWLPRKFRTRELKRRALQILKSFELLDLRAELAGNLSGGQQKLLELARVLMLNPRLLLLDEPFYGIHAAVKREILEHIQIMNKEAEKTFLIISHDVPSIMNVCQMVCVMNAGETIKRGPPKEIRQDSTVIEAYLGE